MILEWRRQGGCAHERKAFALAHAAALEALPVSESHPESQPGVWRDAANSVVLSGPSTPTAEDRKCWKSGRGCRSGNARVRALSGLRAGAASPHELPSLRPPRSSRSGPLLPPAAAPRQSPLVPCLSLPPNRSNRFRAAQLFPSRAKLAPYGVSSELVSLGHRVFNYTVIVTFFKLHQDAQCLFCLSSI